MRCAEYSLVDEPLAGTAPIALGFALVEHPGPWGEKALAEAGLGELEAECKALGLKALLVRRADRSTARGRAFAVWCGEEPFAVEVAPAALETSLEQLAAGIRPAGTAPAPRMWLICTNGKRDACCARDGVPVARALAALRPDQAWECSHLGGHRFAANVALLPEGLCFGRVSEANAPELVAAIEDGRVPHALLRGRMSVEPPLQAAEIAARAAGALTGLSAAPTSHDGSTATVAGLRVELHEEPLTPRPVSCGAEPEPVSAWHAQVVARA
jgi:hypothetical protein